MNKHSEPFVIETIKQEDTQAVELHLVMPDTLTYFEGHFPTNPILPGVAQLDLAINYAVHYLGLDKNRFDGVKQMKFMKIIQPNQELKLLISIEMAQLSFRYSFENTVYSTGIIKLRENFEK